MNIISYLRTVVVPWVRARINPKSELGASLVEYALLVALIAVVCILAITFLGREANNAFSQVGVSIADAGN